MHSPDTIGPPAPAALSAFLRGVERRGAVFGQLQCGGHEAAEHALSAAMRAFRSHAAGLPMTAWPQRFWTLLAASPGLRQPVEDARWPDPLLDLSALAPVLRQALLLRLVAGLEEEVAAEVMDLPTPAYRDALGGACPRNPAGAPDPAAWRALAEAVQGLVRHLPPDQLARIARLREAAISGARVSPTGGTDQAGLKPGVRARGRMDRSRRRWALWVALGCAAALAATFLVREGPSLAGDDGTLDGEVRIIVEELPERPPAARFDAATAMVTHPDLELLLDPDGLELAARADFLAWYAAVRGQEKDGQQTDDPRPPLLEDGGPDGIPAETFDDQ